MKPLRHLLLLCVLATLLGACENKELYANFEVIPLPQQIIYSLKNNNFHLTDEVVIFYPDSDLLVKRNAEFLAYYLKECSGKTIPLQSYKTKKDVTFPAIFLECGETVEEDEGYVMKIEPHYIGIKGRTPQGVFYGVQTLRKAAPARVKDDEEIIFPAVLVADYPRFPYRGMHLDVGRHFFPVEFIKDYIDLLALHNMNTFHWHLTEDQGWRIEIKKYPRLTEIGSKRSGTVIGRNSGQFDSISHEGFYTQEQIKEVVAYAAERFITIIPEIDLPGHMLAALAAYPELGCTGGPYEVEQTWGVFDDVLCMGNDDTMTFLEGIMDEVIELFPSEYIHIGGDEAPRVRWKECAKCQRRIVAEELKADDKHSAEDRLQSYCMTRIEHYLNERGRRIIGWDEILEGDVAPNATVMSWRGVKGGVEAAKLGHDVIMTPNDYMYFDYYQTAVTEDEPLAIGGYVPLEKVYSFDPALDELTEEEQKRVLGVQANVWTEYIPTTKQVEYMILPRMAALAEVQWTMPKRKDYKYFTDACRRMMKLYERDSLNFATHIFDITPDYSLDEKKRAVVVKLTTVDDAPIYYTLDGSEPTKESAKFKKKLKITQKATLKAVAIREDGTMSRVLTENIVYNKATGMPIILTAEPSSRYAYKGASTLVDGLMGSNNYASGRWLGFLTDAEAVIDLGRPTEINSVSTKAFVSHGSWIMGATQLAVFVSDDGETYKEVAVKDYPASTEVAKKGIECSEVKFSLVQASYVKVLIKCTPQLPIGHPGEGKKAYLFIDEIIID